MSLGDGFGVSHTLRRLAYAWNMRGDNERASVLAKEALALARAAHDKNATAWALHILGLTIWIQSHDPGQTLPLAEESLSLAREIRDPFLIGVVLFILGQVAQAQGDFGRAQTAYAESLATFRGIGTQDVTAAASLVGFAELAGLQGWPERAARLFGAVVAFVKDVDNVPLGKRADFERSVNALHTQLGEAMFAAAWAEGQAMTLDQAIAYALVVNSTCSIRE